MAAITGHASTTTNAVNIAEIVSDMVIRAREANYVGVKVFKTIVSEEGDKVKFAKTSIPTAVDFAQGDNLLDDLSAATEGEIVLTMNKHKVSPFLIPDFLDEQAKHNLLVEKAWAAGQAIAKAMDTDVLAEADNFTPTAVGTDGSAITYATLTSAVEALDENDVPDTDRHFIFSPAAKKDLLDLNLIQSIEFNDVKGAVTGTVGATVLGAQVHFSTNVASGATGKKNIYAHREAVVIGMQRAPRYQSEYKLEYLGTLGNVSAAYGVEAYRLDHGIIVRGRA